MQSQPRHDSRRFPRHFEITRANAQPVHIWRSEGGLDVDRDESLEQDLEQDVDVDSSPSESALREAEAILVALEGGPTGSGMQRIRSALTSPDGPTYEIYEILSSRVPGVLEQIRGAVTVEDWRAIRSHALRTGEMPALERFAAGEIVWEIGTVTLADSSAQVLAIFMDISSGAPLDGTLAELEKLQGPDPVATADWLFGHGSFFAGVDRVTAQRLAGYLAAASARGLQYAASYHATAVTSLLEGVTGTADSAAILRHFEAMPPTGRALMMQRLQAEWLMDDMAAADYATLRTLEGLVLPERGEPGLIEQAAVLADYGRRGAQILACIPLGTITGALSVVWDLVRSLWDILVAAKTLAGMVVYWATGGEAGRESLQSFQKFWGGLVQMFGDPGTAFDAWWDDVSAGFQTIEGPLSDCRRTEYTVRHLVNAVITLILTFVGGYGAVKGGLSAARTTATAANMIRTGRGAALGGEIAAAGSRTVVGIGSALASLRGLSGARVVAALGRARASLSQILVAAQDYEVWAALRRGIATERAFWESQRAFWAERGWQLQTEHDALVQRLQSMARGTAASIEAASEEALPAAEAVDTRAASLVREVSATGWVPVRSWDTPPAGGPGDLFHALPAEGLPQLERGYGWARVQDHWQVYRSPDAPDVGLTLRYWAPDPEGNWAAVIMRDDGARISSVSMLRADSYESGLFSEARRKHGPRNDWEFGEFREGHLTEQADSVRSPEARINPTGDRMLDRTGYTSEHEANFVQEPVWWNDGARNQLFVLLRNERRNPGRPGASRFPPPPGAPDWANATRYRVLMEYDPGANMLPATSVRGPVVEPRAEWMVVQDANNAVIDAFEVRFGAHPVGQKAHEIAGGWRQLLLDSRRGVDDIPPIVLLMESGGVETPLGVRWEVAAVGALAAQSAMPQAQEESDAR